MVYYIVTSKPGKQKSNDQRRVFSSDSEVKATDLESVSKESSWLEKGVKGGLSNIALSFQLHLISSETGFLGIIFFQEKKNIWKN